MTTLEALPSQQLLRIARDSIAHRLSGLAPPTYDSVDPSLRALAASFVTLTIEDRLRGCIGSLEPYRPLLDDVQANACAAAFQDPRFPPLTAQDLARVRIEVSVLSPLERVPAATETEALARIRPFEDGLVLRHGRQRGTFLPQVWEQLPDRATFLQHLKLKAGLPSGFWDDRMELYRYSVAHCVEPTPAAP